MRFLLVAAVLAVSVAMVYSLNCTAQSDCHAHHAQQCDDHHTHASCEMGVCQCIGGQTSTTCQSEADCPDCDHGHIKHCQNGHCHCSAH